MGRDTRAEGDMPEAVGLQALAGTVPTGCVTIEIPPGSRCALTGPASIVTELRQSVEVLIRDNMIHG